MTLNEIRRRNSVGSYYWFEPSTMRFFRSRVSNRAYPDQHGGAYFVSSEKPPYQARSYSVRYCDRDGAIETVGAFGGYGTSRAAHREASSLSGV